MSLKQAPAFWREQQRLVLEGTQALEFRAAEDADKKRHAGIELVLQRLAKSYRTQRVAVSKMRPTGA